MRFKSALGAAAAGAAVLSVVTGCSTSRPAGQVQVAGAAGARAARYQVMDSVRTWYDRWLYGARTGYATSLRGSYQACLGARSQLYYRGEMKLYPLGGTVRGAAFDRGIIRSLRRHGWMVYPQKPNVQAPGRIYFYGISKGEIGGLMYVVAHQSDLTPWAHLDVRSQCFKRPGPAFPTHSVRLPLPHPGSRP